LSEFHRIVWPYRKYVLVIWVALHNVSKKELQGLVIYWPKGQRIVQIGKLNHTHIKCDM
jgi:hypothetical protein